MGMRVAMAAVFTTAITVVLVILSTRTYDRSGRVVRAERERPAASEPRPEGGEPRRALRLLAVSGEVERQSERSGRGWEPAMAGGSLRVSDRLRTGEGGRAKIDVGGVEVEIGRATELTVQAAGIELREGRILARLAAAPGERFAVSIGESNVVAESAAGELAVLADGRGAVTVAALSGTARVTAGGAAIELAAGEQTEIRPGAGPGAKTAAPPSLVLEAEPPADPW